MKYPSSLVPASTASALPGVRATDPESSAKGSPQDVPTGTGLIFGGACSVSNRPEQPKLVEREGIRGGGSRIWNWCECLRVSIVLAMVTAGALVPGAKSLAGRAQAEHVSLEMRARRTIPEERVRGEVGAIRYWSDENSTTVTVGLENLVYFEAHRLSDPDRIYFDLEGTRLRDDLRDKVIQVEVAEGFVQKIRIAEWKPGITRVVLETKPGCAYSAMIAPDPYRLVVRLHAPE